jgi:predicted enzyme related to lactoylglutathione lyase
MSDPIVWADLTVAAEATDAETVAGFYRDVLGWFATAVPMAGYDDYALAPADSDAALGICHARGQNADVPPVWLVYVQVADLDAAMRRAIEHGGAVVSGPRPLADARFAVIRDPAGAHLALTGP